jgi:peptide-methionine (S)-S-oxide reductase
MKTVPSQLEKIALGGGCHWCTEGVFVSLLGVEKVEQGWVSSDAPNEAFSEAVILHFNPDIVSLKDLIAVHLETHASTKIHGLRHRYRSAVYAFSEEQRLQATFALESHAKEAGERFITTALPFVAFKASLPEHQDYYRKDPDKPFCRRFISPKLKMLREMRPGLMRKED